MRKSLFVDPGAEVQNRRINPDLALVVYAAIGQALGNSITIQQVRDELNYPLNFISDETEQLAYNLAGVFGHHAVKPKYARFLACCLATEIERWRWTK